MIFLRLKRRNAGAPRVSGGGRPLCARASCLRRILRGRQVGMFLSRLWRPDSRTASRRFGLVGTCIISLSLLAPLQIGLVRGVGISTTEAKYGDACAWHPGWTEGGAPGTCTTTTGQSVTQTYYDNLSPENKTALDARDKKNAKAKDALPAVAGECSWSVSNWVFCFGNVIYLFTVYIGSTLAYMAAVVLNTAIVLSLNGTSYALGFITESWSIVRDIANMAFLFILVYIAITIMLKAETSGVMQTLAMVIVMALLINFSFLITRVVIDGGNIIAVQFYNAIPLAPPPASGTAAAPAGSKGGAVTEQNCLSVFTELCKNSRDVTAAIMNAVQIQGTLSTDGFSKLTGSVSGQIGILGGLLLVYIATAIMFYMLMGMFLYAAVLFIIRIVTLWFLIIAAPLALAAEAIPGARFKGYYQEWQSRLISNAFYPALLLFIFLMLSKLMKSFSTTLLTATPALGSSETFIGTITGIIGFAAIKMGLVLGFLMVGISFTKRVSASVGESSIHLAGAVSGWAQGKVRNVGLGAGRAVGSTAYAYTAGAGAGLANRGLARTRVGNLWGVQQLRDLTLGKMASSQPIRGAGSIGSYDESRAQREKWSKQRKDARRDIENKKMVERAPIIQTRLKEIDETHARTIGMDAPLDKKTSEEKERLLTEQASIKNRVATLDKREMGSLNATQLANVAHLLSESQRKTAEGLEKLSESERDAITEKWHTEAGGSPLKKSNDIIKQLRTINASISHLVPHENLADHIGGNVKLDAESIKKLTTKLGNKLDAAKTEYDMKRRTVGTPSSEIMKANTDVRLAQQGVDAAKKLGEELKNIPGIESVNQGKAGVFTTSPTA